MLPDMSTPTRDEICDRFLESLPYAPYAYQEEALLAWFSSPAGVMVCAPTGMGKTLIAEAAIFEALHAGRRLYYTTPLIALTDQKYREIQELAERWGFSREQVGLITGNRKENPDALVRVVVAEILLNHLLASDQSLGQMDEVMGVVMDEFHSFNDLDRGVVWELSLALLPAHVRVLLLSATVGNPVEFAGWLRREHGRSIELVRTDERKVPLEFVWVEDKLLTEQLPAMSTGDDTTNRTPALVFCFNRDECWEVAEKLKGLKLSSTAQRDGVEAFLGEHGDDLAEGVGPKLRTMLVRGVGVHHAGVLPKHKQIVEELFNRKLVPFVVCTETLAAGINLPARSVVLSTLLKGKRGEKKLIPASSAHQMFGRAGRPQFDDRGFVVVVAHDDDVKINKWKAKYDQIDPNSKDPGILRARKDLERKRPSRRKTEQYWTEGQLKTLIEAGPAKLSSRGMLPYHVLIFLLTRYHELAPVRAFLNQRFATAEKIEKFQQQLDFMIGNLVGLGYLARTDDGEHIELDESIFSLLNFRSVDPLYGRFLAQELAYADYTEKILALESVLEMPPAVLRHIRIPTDLPTGPLQRDKLEPQMIAMGVNLTPPDPDILRQLREDPWADVGDVEWPPTFPEMLKLAFEAQLANPEPVNVQGKWLAGLVFNHNGEFYAAVKATNLVKQEGLVLRHLLRMVILASEFHALAEDPDYQQIGEAATRACRRVDARYTDRFLAEAQQVRQLANPT